MTPLLQEAKTLGRHKKAINPWRHHAKVATARALISPRAQKQSETTGQARVARRLHTLEVNFKKALIDLFMLLANNKKPSAKRMKGIFRGYYTMAFQLGKLAGGLQTNNPLPPLTREDSRWLEAFLRKEFDYWKRFSKEIESDATNKRHPRRLDMYLRTLRAVYHSARLLEVPPQTLFYWRTAPAEHCPHCLFLATNGPYTKANLPTVPGVGTTRCLSMCKCSVQTQQVGLREYLKVSRNARSREELLRLMKALAKT